MRRVGEKRRYSEREESGTLDWSPSAPTKRPRRATRESQLVHRSEGLLARFSQLLRRLFSFQWLSRPQGNAASTPPTHSPLTRPEVIVVDEDDDNMSEAPISVRVSPPPSHSPPLSPHLPSTSVSARPPPPSLAFTHSPERRHHPVSHLTSSTRKAPREQRLPSKYNREVTSQTKVLRGMEEAKGHRRYQQFLDRQSVLTSLPNHVHRPRQPETTGVLPNPSHLPSPLPSPPSTRSSTFYTLPRVPNSPTLFTSPNFTSPLWSRNQPLTADFRQRPHRPPQVPSPWEGLRRTGGGVKGGVRTEGGMRGAMDPPERLVSAAKDTAGTPPAPPTRCREVLQWSQWLDELNQDSSRRRAEIEVAEKYLLLYQQDRERLEDARTERLRRQIDRIGLEPELEEEEMELVLTPEQQQKVFGATQGPRSEVLSDKFRIQIKRCDIATLTGLEWLNDEIINFYFQLIAERSRVDMASTEQNHKINPKKVHVMSSFFYPKLVQTGYSGVRRWTRKVDLFQQDVVLLPIHLGMHWCLAVIDFSQSEIVYYDSLHGSNYSCMNRLREYLKEESQDKRGVALDLSGWQCRMPKDIPQQLNGSDCGVFTCMYARYVARGLSFAFSQADMRDIRSHMICEILEQQLF